LSGESKNAAIATLRRGFLTKHDEKRGHQSPLIMFDCLLFQTKKIGRMAAKETDKIDILFLNHS
jgi:hypothetical protein